MEANATTEPSLDFERDAVIIRDARVGLHEEIADLRVEAPAINRFARWQHAGLHGVEVPGVAQNIAGAKIQVSGRDNGLAAYLVRDLTARLVAMRCLDRAIEGIGKPNRAGDGHLACRQKR